MSAKTRLVRWGPAKMPGRVRRSLCGLYEISDAPSPREGAGQLWTVVFRPDLRGSYGFRVLFVERGEDRALDLLDAFEAERRNQEAKAA